MKAVISLLLICACIHGFHAQNDRVKWIGEFAWKNSLTSFVPNSENNPLTNPFFINRSYSFGLEFSGGIRLPSNWTFMLGFSFESSRLRTTFFDDLESNYNETFVYFLSPKLNNAVMGISKMSLQLGRVFENKYVLMKPALNVGYYTVHPESYMYGLRSNNQNFIRTVDMEFESLPSFHIEPTFIFGLKKLKYVFFHCAYGFAPMRTNSIYTITEQSGNQIMIMEESRFLQHNFTLGIKLALL